MVFYEVAQLAGNLSHRIEQQHFSHAGGMVLLPRPARLEPLASVFSTTGGFGSPPKPVYTSLNGVLTPAPGTSTHQNPVYAARELDTAVGKLR